MQELPGTDDADKLHHLCALSYKEQAIHFLNAFWDTIGSKVGETLWVFVEEYAKLDLQLHGEGSGLDEVNAHRFLEVIHETLTVLALRERLRKTGALTATERPKVVPLTHYLLWKYEVDWHILVNAKEGNSEEIIKAQQLLDEALRQAELARQAQREVDAALREVRLQEDARNSRTLALQQLASSGGLVQQNKAKNELAQHLGEDPLPLRKAKITLEAALRKAELATRGAEAAVAEAEAYLEDVKMRTGSPQGRIWWMERELHEQKKYLPSSRGGIARAK